MGNIIRMRKKVTEELDSLSQKVEVFRDDIEKTAEAKRMFLWYLTLSTFFLSTSAIAYVWIMLRRKDQQVLFSILSFVAGQLILWLGRRAANAFYNWRISRKRQILDGLLAKKKSLLETVKETETFKVAKEILDKYDQEPPSMESIGSSRRGLPESSVQHMGTDVLVETDLSRPPKTSRAKVIEDVPSEATPRRASMDRSRIQPIRPFQREGTTFVDKLVDYFFGDGPSQRYALICISCHSHNGMALPAEYDYLAFVCFVCGHFNPARKFRPMKSSTSPGPTTRSAPKTHILTDVQDFCPTSLNGDNEPEKTTEKRMKIEGPFNGLSEKHVEVVESVLK